MVWLHETNLLAVHPYVGFAPQCHSLAWLDATGHAIVKLPHSSCFPFVAVFNGCSLLLGVAYLKPISGSELVEEVHSQQSPGWVPDRFSLGTRVSRDRN